MSLTSDERELLRERFSGARDDIANRNAVQRRIGQVVAQNTDVIDLLGEIDVRKRTPTQLFAGVRYLASIEVEDELHQLYQAVNSRVSQERIGNAFVRFCLARDEALVAAMQARTARRNEINRCCAFVPAFMHIARKTGRQLGLIEIGASAGLKLLFDRFHFNFDHFTAGPPGAAVRLHTHNTGVIPMFDGALPFVDARVGIDAEPLNAADEDDARWLRACVPLGEVVHEQRLEAVLELARREWIDVQRTNISIGLPRAVDEMDDDLELCIFSAHTVTNMLPSEREALEFQLMAISQARSVWWISLEPNGTIATIDESWADAYGILTLQHLWPGGDDTRVIAIANYDCSNIEWHTAL